MHLATKWSLITPFYRWPKGGATRFHLLVCAITYVSDCVRNFCRPNDHHFSVPAINTKHDLRMIVLWFCDTSCCVHRNRQFLKNIIKAVRDLSNAELRDTNDKKKMTAGNRVFCIVMIECHCRLCARQHIAIDLIIVAITITRISRLAHTITQHPNYRV